MKVLGHRGAIDGTVYQNSLLAYEKAMKEANGLELDVVLSSDGVLYCIHDTKFIDEVVNDFPSHIAPENNAEWIDKVVSLKEKYSVEAFITNYPKEMIDIFQNKAGQELKNNPQPKL